MAATIQHIELPKKPRALDSSTSAQVVSQELIVNGDFASDTAWGKVSSTITGGKGVLDGGGGSQNSSLYQLILNQGRKYRLVFDVSGHNGDTTDSRVVDLQNNTIYDITGDATGIIVEFTHKSAYPHIFFQAKTGSAFDIDNVSILEIENFSNNNHGKIYSGRALEFDGVSDYLDGGAMRVVSTGAWTVGAWINAATIASEIRVSSGNTQAVNSNEISIRDGKLSIYDHGTAWRQGNTVINVNTWYRALWVYDGAGELTFYLNGEADGTGAMSTSGDKDDLQVRYVGMAGNVDHWWNGMLADYQAWDAAFTATDAAYDYANPESLALNASGTALTEGNLKVWYPMQDGHRGQQSYILDLSLIHI